MKTRVTCGCRLAVRACIYLLQLLDAFFAHCSLFTFFPYVVSLSPKARYIVSNLTIALAVEHIGSSVFHCEIGFSLRACLHLRFADDVLRRQIDKLRYGKTSTLTEDFFTNIKKALCAQRDSRSLNSSVRSPGDVEFVPS